MGGPINVARFGEFFEKKTAWASGQSHVKVTGHQFYNSVGKVAGTFTTSQQFSGSSAALEDNDFKDTGLLW